MQKEVVKKNSAGQLATINLRADSGRGTEEIRSDDVSTPILKILHQDGHEILIVGSGGCLSLSSLAYKNVSLHLVEINELQNKLIRLKVCAFNNLSFENCMYFFGTFTPPKEYRDRLDIFWKLSNYLSSDDRKYWKSNLKMVSQKIF